MKKFILTFFLLLYSLVYSNNKINISENQTPNKQRAKETSFLTSFIEGDQIFLNIPQDKLDKPILFRRYDDLKFKNNYIQIVWSKFNDKIILKNQSIISTSGIIIPFKERIPLMDNIIAIFPILKNESSNEVYKINITKLVLSMDLEWPQWPSGKIGVPNPQTSLLMGAKNLENEVIIKTRQALTKNGTTISFFIYFGFSSLPNPMKGRLYDYRMGFNNELGLSIYYGIDINGTNNSIANISRWRLEKRNKNQKISEPIKPITFILSPEIPKRWRPYIKAGIEEWLPAFEAAGFKNSIIVKEVDSISEWERISINNNIVNWSKTKYLRGGENEDYGGTISSVIDYRTGEVLRSDVILGSSAQNYEDNYFIRAAPLDKRAQKFPFPDEVIGRMFQCLAAHETGHAFGLRDANYGEYSYSVDKMGDVDWLENMGYTPSIMNYTRPNNIAQPEDKVPPHLLVQKVGPTDIYNIKWAYTEFLDGITAEEEQIKLEEIIRLQDSISWYRYNSGQYEIVGPSMTSEVVDTNDPVKSTKLALKNIKRVIEMLPDACSNQRDNSRLERLHDKTIELWYNHMRSVVSLIAGYKIHYKSINQSGNIFNPIPKESQIQALDFLIQNAFNTPNWLANPVFSSRIRYSAHPDRILEYQQKLVSELLRALRLKRFEYMDGLKGYNGILEIYLKKIQSGLFQELKDIEGYTKPRKQEIQSTYIETLINIVSREEKSFRVEDKKFDYTDYSKGLLMQQLIILKKDIEKFIKKNKKSNSIGHWQLCLKKLNEI